MLFAPSKVLQRRAELSGDDDPEVDAFAVGADRGLVTPGLDNRLRPLPVGERADDGRTVLARRQDVDITDRWPPPPDRPSRLDGADRVEVSDELDEAVGDGASVAE